MSGDMLSSLFFFIFIVSLLFTIRVSYFYLQKIVKSLSDEDNDIIFKLDNSGLLLLNMSLSYIITYLFKII